jgi:hypothetical protein
MSDATDPLARVEKLLSDVLQLTARVIADKHTWKATPDDVEILSRVSGLTNQTLPAETFKSATVALGFLLMGKFHLETLVKQLKGTDS